MNDFVMIAIAAVVAFVLGVLACILIHRQKAKSDQRKIADAETEAGETGEGGRDAVIRRSCDYC